MAVYLFVLAVPAQAGCNTCAKQSDFFDFAYAKRMWTELRTRDQLEAEWERVGTQYEAAQKQGVFVGSGNEIRARLKELPNAKEIMQGHDLDVTYNRVWVKVASDQYAAGSIAGINQADEDRQMCEWARRDDIFNHQCNALPDWRTKEQVAADAALQIKIANQ
ncbi:hypothetical protein [Thalassospira profundimaris]|nr:hypothetical protein [Thalassospira profundimaris]